MTALTQEQKLRYNRHIILDGFGREGQERLMQGRVLLVASAVWAALQRSTWLLRELARLASWTATT